MTSRDDTILGFSVGRYFVATLDAKRLGDPRTARSLERIKNKGYKLIAMPMPGADLSLLPEITWLAVIPAKGTMTEHPELAAELKRVIRNDSGMLL